MQIEGNSRTWQQELISAVTDPKELIEILQLDPTLLEAAKQATKLFPLKVPHSFIARMQINNLNDPLLKQVLPIGAELKTVEGYKADPLKEAAVNPIPGLLHKYHGRVLLTLTSTCGINCRFCFRREFPYHENNPGSLGWEKVFDYIQQDSSIQEVILSGGDPLAVSDALLQKFIQELANIAHVKRLRIHSRMPIVIPARITHDLINAISHEKLKTILVVHCNHPQEIDSHVAAAMQQLKDGGITLFNQAVLLKGINDHVDTQIALSETLFAAHVQPYYLHLLDKVQGAAHFDIPLTDAKQLHWEMSQRLSGYLVPKLVYEKPGAPAKLLIASHTAGIPG